jgi:hypothetical protein
VTSKRVLVIGWSQSGQLRRVADAFTQPFVDAGHEVHRLDLAPATPFPFPWSVATFFGEFPETVLGRPRPNAPLHLPPGEWDLVVLAAQVWFMAPSQPVAAFLQGPDAAVLDGRRVLTLMSCRNMWVRGWSAMVRRVRGLGGVVTDRVVATQSGSVFASYFSTLAFMLTGRRDAIKVLPAAEIGPDTFARLTLLGQTAAARLSDAPPLAPLLPEHAAAALSYPHAWGEQLVGPLFPVIGAAIAAVSRHGSWLRGALAHLVLAFILSCVFGLLIPCFATEWMFRRWLRPWLDGRARLDAPPSTTIIG